MENERQLMSKDAQTGERSTGIPAPDMIQQEMTADEDDIKQDEINASSEPKVSLNELSFNELREDEKMEEEKSSFDGEENTKGKCNDKEISANVQKEERCAVEVGNTSGENSTLEIERELIGEDNLEKAANDTAKKSIEEEKGNTQGRGNDKKSSKGNYYNEAVVVVVDDGNNNIENIEQAMKKDRRARFSSEVTIQPKAYFNLSTETVVTLSPSTTAADDDVFKQDSKNSTECDGNPEQPVVATTKDADSVHPRTFYPLTIFTCLFCPMIGLFAVYKSYSVKQFIKKGDLRKAGEASQHARQLGLLTLCTGFFFVLAIITIVVLISTLT